MLCRASLQMTPVKFDLHHATSFTALAEVTHQGRHLLDALFNAQIVKAQATHLHQTMHSFFQHVWVATHLQQTGAQHRRSNRVALLLHELSHGQWTFQFWACHHLMPLLSSVQGS